MLARIQEEELEKQKAPRRRIVPVGRPPPAATEAAPQARAAAQPRPGGDESAQERQLKEFRRANGFCFLCGDKYSREHQCKRTREILMIEVGDFGEILSDDIVYALQLLDLPDAQEPGCVQFHNMQFLERKCPPPFACAQKLETTWTHFS